MNFSLVYCKLITDKGWHGGLVVATQQDLCGSIPRSVRGLYVHSLHVFLVSICVSFLFIHTYYTYLAI